MVKLCNKMLKDTNVGLTAVRGGLKYARCLGVRKYSDVSCPYCGGTVAQLCGGGTAPRCHNRAQIVQSRPSYSDRTLSITMTHQVSGQHDRAILVAIGTVGRGGSWQREITVGNTERWSNK